MLDALAEAPALYRPSTFWSQLNRRHLQELDQGGFDNFKRTLSLKYFTWRTLGILRHQLLPVSAAWGRAPSLDVFRSEFLDWKASPGVPGSFNPLTAQLYKVFVSMLAERVERDDSLGLFRTLEEPVVGNPFRVRYKGRWLSQDLCNSIHELYSILGREGQLDRDRRLHFAEIGAGYGRLADVVLRALPNASYCIVDIPPALYVSQRYLSTVFPDERIFRFRDFRSYQGVRAEFESARIRFLEPHQLELLPSKAFDTFVHISSLHEMTREQIGRYLDLTDRLCRGRVYLKQWTVSRAGVNGFVIPESEYPIPRSWQRVYHERHPIQRMFFHALYRTG